MPRHELAVIEGRWQPRQNLQVGRVFDVLSDLVYKTPHGYFYHQFSNAESLEHVVRHVASMEHTRFLYLGAHGNEDGLYGSLGNDEGLVSRKALRDTLWRCWSAREGSFDGLFIGACSFLTEKNAKYLLCGEDAPSTLKWVAGYESEIDWIDATMLDVMFFQRVLRRREPKPVQRVRAASEELFSKAGDLCRSLKFNVYVRKTGVKGEVMPLLRPLNAPQATRGRG